MTRRALLALALVALTVTGCTSSKSVMPTTPTANATVTASPTPTTPIATTVTVFTPFGIDDELASGIVVASTEPGTCQGSNLLARSDALRCFLGNNIHDPCFSAQSANPRVICATGPEDHQAVEVTLTESLPTTDEPAGDLTSGSPWTVTLVDGQTCGALGGATTTLGGQRLNYGCDRGDIYGDVDRSTALWTVLYRPSNSPTLTKVTVTAVTF